MSAVVGPVLVGINHGDAILAGAVSASALAKILLTMIVPYAVATYGAVASLRRTTTGDRNHC